MNTLSRTPQNVSFRAAVYLEKLEIAALAHDCARHEFFSFVSENNIERKQIAGLLKNYDAHASVLRRLLLKTCTIMPDEAVGFVIENVRNEYGNGASEDRHQNQLRDLAKQALVTKEEWDNAPIHEGVREFIRRANFFYNPTSNSQNIPPGLYRPAIAAGAITATEILALREFCALQKLFARRFLDGHVWFDHITVEAEHRDESLALAAYFIDNRDALDAVEYGLKGILDANVHLYDGLLQAARS